MDGEISNIKKWIILYPIYINSKRTIAEGRRISTSKACENPTCAEIGDCCSHLKLLFAIEIDKAYQRDFMQRGRVRVMLKKEDGTFSNPAISSRGMDGEISNIKKWLILYPIYINSKKTIVEGRRISTSKACENPTCAEIGDCCSHLKLPFAIEIDKAYPRDFMQRGRVRVMLKKEDGTLSNAAISSRKQLMLRIAELVPRHPGRTKKQEPAATSTSGAGPSKSGKGGKKKR
ncbi:hypothetical protein HYC85_007864 [Camellia sinensis]|uniref:Signal recognition particle 19 kDa protein n=1 Tax=Camellia sinensis TaxID=4442 RepID=A0A7J7HSK7_CAMSI|nr:hypothetical protein HYC85_007864 [Camellia sinensis]